MINIEAAVPNNDTLTKGMRGRKKAACQAEEEEEQGEEEEGSSENMEVKPTVQRGGRAPRRSKQRLLITFFKWLIVDRRGAICCSGASGFRPLV